MTTKTEDRHPFGELLTQYRLRKPGLSQTRLAELAGYDQAILVRMCQGKKDLTGPSGRERAVRLIETLADQGALTTLDEANGLLLAANLPPLFEKQPVEAKLMTRFLHALSGHRVRRTNLPASLSSFIGRTDEIAEIRRLLGITRLLTLTGAGGVGKTRLAQRVAADVLIQYAGGVWYTELAALTDPALIADAVARALGLVVSERPAADQLADYLRDRHTLLVLDNCEYLIDAVAEFAVVVLHACPRVTILATSREVLNMEGEMAWRVPPMQLEEASRLFVERAAVARNETPLSARDETVAHICGRLDGMPLAIELAAARLQSLSLNDIAARLDDRFSLLTGGRRGALPRHQTLRALIDWSYDALSEPEKVAFRRLGVFVGGWALDIAADVIGNDAELMLTQLIRKSLVVVDEHEGATRYFYLETIREYALEKLREYGELAMARGRHAETFAEFAERSVVPLRSQLPQQWRQRLDRDFLNIQAALNWSFETDGNALTGCRIVSALYVPWRNAQTYRIDIQRWARQAKNALTDDMPHAVSGGVWMAWATMTLPGWEHRQPVQMALAHFEAANDLHGIADAKWQLGELLGDLDDQEDESRRVLEESMALARSVGDVLIEHCAMRSLALRAEFHLNFDRSEVLYRELIGLCRKTDDKANLSMALWEYGNLLIEQERYEEAVQCGAEATQAAQQIRDHRSEKFARGMIAECTRYLGDLPRSVELNEELLLFTRENLSPIDLMLPTLFTSKALNDAGNHDRAQMLMNELITMHSGSFIDHPYYHGIVFDILGCIVSGRGDAAGAARLFGAADTKFAAAHNRRYFHNERDRAPYIAKARAALGDEAYDAAYAEGRAMTVEQAIDYALDG